MLKIWLRLRLRRWVRLRFERMLNPTLMRMGGIALLLRIKRILTLLRMRAPVLIAAPELVFMMAPTLHSARHLALIPRLIATHDL